MGIFVRVLQEKEEESVRRALESGKTPVPPPMSVSQAEQRLQEVQNTDTLLAQTDDAKVSRGGGGRSVRTSTGRYKNSRKRGRCCNTSLNHKLGWPFKFGWDFKLNWPFNL